MIFFQQADLDIEGIYLGLIGSQLISGLFDHVFADGADVVVILWVGIGAPHFIDAMPSRLTL